MPIVCKSLDEFNLMMIEQPLAHDEIIDHAILQAQLQTPICLDECIRSAHHAEQAIRMKRLRHHQHQTGPRRRIPRGQARSRFRAGARHPGVVRRHARIRHRPRAQHRALHAARISFCPAMFPPASVIGSATSSRPRSKSPRKAPSPFPPARASATKSITISRKRSPCGRKTGLA